MQDNILVINSFVNALNELKMKIIGLHNPSIQHYYLFVNSTGSKSFTVHDATAILSLLTSTRARCIEAMSC